MRWAGSEAWNTGEDILPEEPLSGASSSHNPAPSFRQPPETLGTLLFTCCRHWSVQWCLCLWLTVGSALQSVEPRSEAECLFSEIPSSSLCPGGASIPVGSLRRRREGEQPLRQVWKSKAKPNGKKPATEEKKMYLEPEYTKSRITDVGFKELVVLPREIDLNEWLASNTTTFFHHVNLQYSTISEFCTGEACQTMAVCNTQYYWYDERGKKVKCTAPQYVDFVMSSVQKLVTDEDVFPTKYGREFPSSFESLVKKICKYLFHVLAHIYWSHFKETLALELHGHLNTLYVHFILFAREFNLLDPKETAVMDDLTEVLCSAGGRGGGGGDGASGGGTGAQNHVKER
ncbi:MOB kinase activator 2 isoform X1 [Vulpes lagopus]|uniref:MOB kinase activator 2 isoform X1 n=1 Tax=Vulpes lagopus TaxID=494514 RepID=UPI001BC94B4C|nr:MOB kinase activator 2 isoform X1 [Vulpes lagopus]